MPPLTPKGSFLHADSICKHSAVRMLAGGDKCGRSRRYGKGISVPGAARCARLGMCWHVIASEGGGGGVGRGAEGCEGVKGLRV